MKHFLLLVYSYTNPSTISALSRLRFVAFLQFFVFSSLLWFCTSSSVYGINPSDKSPKKINKKTHSASIGNWVWLDLNKDGIQDEHEEGLNDFVVILYNEKTNQVISTKTKNHPKTGKAGYYHFDGLTSNSYFLVFEIPEGFRVAPKDVNNNKIDAFDSDAYPFSGATDSFYLKVGEKKNNWSTGLCLPLLTDVDTSIEE